MTLTVRPLTGDEIVGAIDDLARLRMTVFAEWPYLYAGDAAYEAEYLAHFIGDPDAVLVAAYDGARIVGAATASPMDGQEADIKAPFAAGSLDTSRLFYFGESVLLPEYRGRGVGHAFFDLREAQAMAWGAIYACFCAVLRPRDHPARPPGYVPLDAFWLKRGYRPIEGLAGEMSWQDHGDTDESAKPMQYWVRAF